MWSFVTNCIQVIYKPDLQWKQNAGYPHPKDSPRLVVPSQSRRQHFPNILTVLLSSGVEEDWDSAQLQCELWAPDSSPNMLSLSIWV